MSCHKEKIVQGFPDGEVFILFYFYKSTNEEKSPGARIKALKLTQRANCKEVETSTTAPQPVLSCKQHKLCAPTVKDLVFDALSLTEKDLKAHSDDLVRCLNQIASSICGSPSRTLRTPRKQKVRELVASYNSAYNKVQGRPTMYKVGAGMTTKNEDEALGKARSEAKKCHITTRHDSKDQLPKPEMAGRVYLIDLEPPGRKSQLGPENVQATMKAKKQKHDRKCI
ncbi:hypothetical protein PIB30_062241 [Stylosanthes scabra]|uniref:Uncharacterized protein n=1 Tax=Stylosanthes scabra TaxID=79078 RepID=A0ABU6UJV6_9FABA|nr:hypothetical protein [Stylosanthes scabra]